ncbi:MAG: S26 family signal peptidase [Deltaproteobacteria bacterium]|nr:S26 family signal peptidase [Deltaproteobacteria bacterium]
MNRHTVSGALGCMLVLYLLYGAAGLRWNFSPSLPVGLWRLTHEQIQRGSYVTFDEPIKQVAGLPGDLVVFTEQGIYINGQLWPQSAPVGPNHYPFTAMVLQPGQYLLMGHHPLSWDARYSGWTTATIIASTARPVWVKR